GSIPMPHTVRHVAFAVACALAFAATVAAGDDPRPNLVEKDASASDHSLRAGGTLVASDVVANRGDARARRSVTAYYLVAADRIRLGGRAVRRPRPRRRSRGERTVSVPASTAPGTYRLVAGAEDRGVVDEPE